MYIGHWSKYNIVLFDPFCLMRQCWHKGDLNGGGGDEELSNLKCYLETSLGCFGIGPC